MPNLRSFVLLVLSLVLLCGAPARAQPTSTDSVVSITEAIEIKPLAGDAKYRELLKRGFYYELLSIVNQEIEALPLVQRIKPDPRLLWYRGVSHSYLGQLADAKADLLAAQNDGRWSYDGKSWLAIIEARIALTPPHVREIFQGTRVLFRVHTFGRNEGTQMVMELLPEAYRINSDIFGVDVEATPVFIFDDYAQYAAYYRQIFGEDPASWATAVTAEDVILISLRDDEAKLIPRNERLNFQTTIVHEFNHAMLNRVIGTAVRPRWFEEGLAQIAGAQVNADFDVDKKKILQRLFQNKTLVPVEKLESGNSFYEQTKLGLAMQESSHRDTAPDPFAQSYGMVKYLLADFSTARLQSFLRRVRTSDDFDGSFAKEFGLTTEQFYEKWKREYPRTLTSQ